MTNITINRQRRLYVIPCGNGYTCLGFEVAEERQRAVASWMGRADLTPRPGQRGTLAG